MSNAYFMHCARCHAAHIAPLPYVAFIRTLDLIGV